MDVLDQILGEKASSRPEKPKKPKNPWAEPLRLESSREKGRRKAREIRINSWIGSLRGRRSGKRRFRNWRKNGESACKVNC